ncbi:hypothetical protein BX661DRAFT_175370 [Kickxella alabastrina]|uniref:uncharacterized protein n=1 Tax=Kickxella alabastrina TaxID=61397 RepID=UPI00221F4ED1|nr:uncharacterized protein BX661DRAFT_175370 [Kickxella alabastrina]KAI7834708.1 hypothetical protein BX661DRAFT_175370 [Kickxella alabastrina]KAJ1946896.1 hypothetical protein GGF37_000846 [Kickxella alabastrina]
MVGIYYPLASSLFANGIFAGLGCSMNFVSVPCIRASSDPLSVFATNLKKAAKIGIITSVVGGASHLYVWYRTGNPISLFNGILSFAIVPFTILFIKPLNDTMLRMHSEKSKDSRKIAMLVDKWNSRQWVRTIAGTIVFVININQCLGLGCYTLWN